QPVGLGQRLKPLQRQSRLVYKRGLIVLLFTPMSITDSTCWRSLCFAHPAAQSNPRASPNGRSYWAGQARSEADRVPTNLNAPMSTKAVNGINNLDPKLKLQRE